MAKVMNILDDLPQRPPPTLARQKDQFPVEIHCPSCGVLRRSIPEGLGRKACPDCGNSQAIFL